ncbi:unnamed protein product [Closterium sp. NIES-65]|nr:unnamed protein product [Closterium sp. NIES-65]
MIDCMALWHHHHMCSRVYIRHSLCMLPCQQVLEQHGRDESYHEAVPPDAVAFARSTHQVQQLVTACAPACPLSPMLPCQQQVLEQHGRDESYHEAVPPDAVAFARSTHQVQQLVTACAPACPLFPMLPCQQQVLEQHGRDESYHEAVPPDAVAFARSTHQVQQLVTACAAARVPVIPYGAGTSLEGHVAALCGGVSIDLSQMNEVVEVHAEDMDCRVQAGVTRQQLNHHLHDSGLFFPVDPGSECTIGGMTATRASGTNAVRYGTMREAVLGVTAVLPNGQIIKTGSRARKSSSGYDLTRLIVGSEGTLAVVTEVALRLYPQPEAVSAAVCPFTSIAGAVDAVIETIQSAIPVARIELLDEVQVDAVNRYSKTHLHPSPTLFFEFHGTAAAVEEQAKQVSEIASGNGGASFEWSTAPEERSKLWAARHSAYYAALALRPNSKGLLADVCVPISRLTELVVLAKQQIEQAQLVAPIVGHVGDGNFHVLFIVDPDNKDELAAVKRVNDSLVARAIAVGGTCSGEHGVGRSMGAQHWMPWQLSRQPSVCPFLLPLSSSPSIISLPFHHLPPLPSSPSPSIISLPFHHLPPLPSSPSPSIISLPFHHLPPLPSSPSPSIISLPFHHLSPLPSSLSPSSIISPEQLWQVTILGVGAWAGSTGSYGSTQGSMGPA